MLARESHFPASIADLYDPNTMPENLRDTQSHDEVLDVFILADDLRMTPSD